MRVLACAPCHKRKRATQLCRMTLCVLLDAGLDYFSVPQPSMETDAAQREGVLEKMKNAINSIPSYISQTSIFVVPCPPLQHREAGAMCDFSSWLTRTWCRLESLALHVASDPQLNSRTPTLIVQADGAAPTLLAPHLVLPPGEGELSCCRMGHRVPDGCGGERCIPCDKEGIASVIVAMLQTRIAHHEARGETDAARMWRATGVYWLRGLPLQWRYAGETTGAAALQPFLHLGQWSSATDSGKAGRSVPPLLAASGLDDSGLVRALIAAGADANHTYSGAPIVEVGLLKGMTALHMALLSTGVGHGGDCTVRALLENGANLRAGGGAYPLDAAAARLWSRQHGRRRRARRGVRGVGQATRSRSRREHHALDAAARRSVRGRGRDRRAPRRARVGCERGQRRRRDHPSQRVQQPTHGPSHSGAPAETRRWG